MKEAMEHGNCKKWKECRFCVLHWQEACLSAGDVINFSDNCIQLQKQWHRCHDAAGVCVIAFNKYYEFQDFRKDSSDSCFLLRCMRFAIASEAEEPSNSTLYA